MPALLAAIGALIVRLAGWIPLVLAWLLELARKLPGIKFALVVALVVGVVAAIPWPEWMTSVGSLFAGLPPGVVWGLDLAQFPAGLAIIASAWSLRFMLRWIRAAVSAA